MNTVFNVNWKYSMEDVTTYADMRAFLIALAYTQPRILALFIAIPIFNRQVLPGMIRLGLGAALGLVVVPTLIPQVVAQSLDELQIILLIVKEVFVGFVLGFLIAIPFWAFEAVGFIIDNQRGASIAATLNPLTGNDSSPLGALFNQAFIVFMFVNGGFLLMLEIVYNSFGLWNVFTWVPHFPAEMMPQFLEQLDRLVRIAVLLGSPVIVAMFLAEVGLALVSRFAPQLQVFFLAMPIKCAIAFLMLALYTETLFQYGEEYIVQLRDILPFMSEQFY